MPRGIDMDLVVGALGRDYAHTLGAKADGDNAELQARVGAALAIVASMEKDPPKLAEGGTREGVTKRVANVRVRLEELLAALKKDAPKVSDATAKTFNKWAPHWTTFYRDMTVGPPWTPNPTIMDAVKSLVMEVPNFDPPTLFPKIAIGVALVPAALIVGGIIYLTRGKK